MGVCHRDIKLDNIMLDSSDKIPVLYINDFGTTKYAFSMDDPSEISGRLCALWLQPPEILEFNQAEFAIKFFA